MLRSRYFTSKLLCNKMCLHLLSAHLQLSSHYEIYSEGSSFALGSWKSDSCRWICLTVRFCCHAAGLCVWPKPMDFWKSGCIIQTEALHWLFGKTCLMLGFSSPHCQSTVVSGIMRLMIQDCGVCVCCFFSVDFVSVLFHFVIWQRSLSLCIYS